MIERTCRPLFGAAILLFGIFTSSAVFPETSTVPDADVGDIVQIVGDQLRANYPFPELSEAFAVALAKNSSAGRYHELKPCDLAARVTEDLRAVHRDLHLNVSCDLPIEESSGNGELDARLGFDAVELDHELPLSYIRSTGPWQANDDAFAMAASAMGMAARAKYVVIDIRNNSGGHGEIGDFLASYFFDHRQLLVEGLFRAPKEPKEEWTYESVPGRRLPDAKLYILVNEQTASAAEGFAFALQRLKRATVIGQRTAGAGIAGSFVPLPDGLSVFVPNKLIVAPGTHEGWEGIGVTPDIVTPPGEEAERALALARKDWALQRDDRDWYEVLPPHATGTPHQSRRTLSDSARSILPNLESCMSKSDDAAANLLTFTNNCGEEVYFQYVESSRPNVVMEFHLRPGYALRTRVFQDGRPNYWWIHVACPKGYYGSLALSPDNEKAIVDERYSCKRG